MEELASRLCPAKIAYDLVTDGAIHVMDFGGLPSAYLILEADNFHRGECSAIIYKLRVRAPN